MLTPIGQRIGILKTETESLLSPALADHSALQILEAVSFQFSPSPTHGGWLPLGSGGAVGAGWEALFIFVFPALSTMPGTREVINSYSACRMRMS